MRKRLVLFSLVACTWLAVAQSSAQPGKKATATKEEDRAKADAGKSGKPEAEKAAAPAADSGQGNGSDDLGAPPPALDESHEFWPGKDPRYASLKPGEVPKTECLKDTVARFLPFWEGEIAPAIKRGERVIIAAHGNSLRALVKHLDNVSDDDIVELNIPTGIPLVYELDDNLKPIKPRYYLGDAEAAEAAAKAVANQTKGKG